MFNEYGKHYDRSKAYQEKIDADMNQPGYRHPKTTQGPRKQDGSSYAGGQESVTESRMRGVSKS